MATRRRSTTTRRSQASRRSRAAGFRLPAANPEIVRSLVGIALLVLGVTTLIALVLPSQGTLTKWWLDSIAPWFGSLRWLLPILLLGVGWYLEWGPAKRPNSGWGLTLLGTAIAFVGLLGALSVLRLQQHGGRIGNFLADVL